MTDAGGAEDYEFHPSLEDLEDCRNCGGTGFSSHDCGEDCCVCLEPEDNVICDWCGGKG